MEFHWGWPRICPKPGWCGQRLVQVQWQKCTVYLRQSEVYVIYISYLCPLRSALTQFFQIFSEFQSNPFYATGEVRKRTSFWIDTIRILLSCTVKILLLTIFKIHSHMQESMFQQLATTSTRTIPLPKWRSTSKEWPLEMVCVTLNWWMKIIFPFFFKCIKCQIIQIHQSAIALNWL